MSLKTVFQLQLQLLELILKSEVQSGNLSQPREYKNSSMIRYQMSDSLGGKPGIIVKPFLKIAVDRLFLSVFAIQKHFD